MDYQLSPSMRLMGKGSAGRFFQPFGSASSNNHPAATNGPTSGTTKALAS